MYEEYSFTLYFDELESEEQERKIDEVILFGYDHQAYDKEKYPDVQDAQNNEQIRKTTRENIERHFPMYF